MPSDDLTGGMKQKMERRKVLVMMAFVGELCWVFGMLVGRYSTEVHSWWYSTVPTFYYPVPSEWLWFWGFGIAMHVGYAAIAVYFIRHYSGQLTRLDGIDEA